MDQVFDALGAEAPYDRCSNEINQSIMLYKDGKDRGLVGGTSNDDNKEEIVKRFYERLKRDLDKVHGSDDNFEIENTGTQVGGYLFNNRNDFVERAEEAFSDTIKEAVSWNNILDIIQNCVKTVVGRCDALIKLNSDLLKQLNKTDFTDLNINISDKLLNEKTSLKEVLTNIDKQDRILKSVNIPEIIDIGEFLRDSLIATSEMTTSIGAASSYLDSKKEPFKDLSSSEIKILTTFKGIIDLSDDDDPFVFKTQSYYADLNTFVIVPNNFGKDVEYGCTISDYKSALEKDNVYNLNNNTRKIIFTSVKRSDKVDRTLDKLYSSDTIGSGKIDLKSAKQTDLDLFKISGDMNVKDFYTQVQKHIDNIKDKDELEKSMLTCLNIVIDQLKRVRTAAVKLETITNKDFTKIKSSEMYVVKMLIHFSCEVLFDSMSTVEGMMSCNMVDNVRKLLLINLTNSLIIQFDSIIRSGLGE